MKSIGETIRKLRVQKDLPLRKVAAQLDIDTSILSKIERGERHFTKEQIKRIAEIFGLDEKKLLIDYLAEKVLYELKGEEIGMEVLKIAEKEIKYNKSKK